MHIAIYHSSATVADSLNFILLILDNCTSEAIIITVTASVILSVHNTFNNIMSYCIISQNEGGEDCTPVSCIGVIAQESR